MIRKFTVPVTTAANGTATVFSPWLSGYRGQLRLTYTSCA